MLIFLRTKLNLNSIREAQDNFVENIVMDFKIIVKNYLDCDCQLYGIEQRTRNARRLYAMTT